MAIFWGERSISKNFRWVNYRPGNMVFYMTICTVRPVFWGVVFPYIEDVWGIQWCVIIFHIKITLFAGYVAFADMGVSENI